MICRRIGRMLKVSFLSALIMAVSLLLGSTVCQAQEQSLDVYYFNVGKADAILIVCGDTRVMIDCGTNKAGKELVESMSQMGITRLDLLVITHFDKDHVGGADKIIEAFQVDRVLEPAYDSQSKQTQQYRDALEEAGIQVEVLYGNISFNLGSAHYEIDVANKDWYGVDEENDFSLVTRLEYGSTSFLFAGDAENQRLQELMEEGVKQADVLKVPHHGRFEAQSANFFAAVSPQYAVITSEEEEPEDPIITELLKEIGTHVFLTRQGTVHMHSDGETIITEQW